MVDQATEDTRTRLFVGDDVPTRPHAARAVTRVVGTSRRASARRIAYAISTSFLACGALLPALAYGALETPREHYELRITAVSDARRPLAGVGIRLDGRMLGSTNRHGRLHAALRSADGRAVSLSSTCPPGHRSEPSTRSIPLHPVQTGKRLTRSIELLVHCQPQRLIVPVDIELTGPGELAFPIFSSDHLVGRTDETGTATLLLEGRPRSLLRVLVDTSSRPLLRPRNPVHTLRIDDADARLQVVQAFETRKRRKRTRPVSPLLDPRLPARPYRIH